MNTTPRLLNRLVLAVVGLLCLAAGAAGLALLVLPGAASWWKDAAPQVEEALQGVRPDTTAAGQSDTWLWIALFAGLVLLIVLLVLWVLAQGRGRAGVFLTGADGRTGSGTAGTVTISAAAAEQVLRAALLERPDLVGASVSTWFVRGVPGLRVRVQPRKGTPPYEVAAEVSRLVEALDAVMGTCVPVLISIRTGSLVRWSRAERVV